MKEALGEARLAFAKGEVPIGAVIVKDGTLVSKAHNLVESLQDCSAHAELLAIRAASEKLSNWRLLECELYVTLEPCSLCTSAIKLSRISKVVFGAQDERMGAIKSKYNLFQDTSWGPAPEIASGVMSDECSLLLKEFFKTIRKK